MGEHVEILVCLNINFGLHKSKLAETTGVMPLQGVQYIREILAGMD